MKKIVFLLIAVALFTGCGMSVKKGVKIWCRGEMPLFTELLQKEFSEKNEQGRELMNAAGLHCLLDVDAGYSTRENPSQSCKCSGAKTKEERAAECAKWVQETKNYGGCYGS